MIESIEVEIQGVSPLLMHRFPMEKIEAIEKKGKEEQAEIAAYRIPSKGKGKGKGNLYLPGTALQRSVIAAAVYSKGKGRASLQKQVAACLLISPEYLDLGVAEYEIDARPVVVPATKGRIVRYRPRLDKWGVKFDLMYDPLLITEIEIRKVVDDAGQRVGVLDFRPACKGPFGRFVVIGWGKE